MDAEAEFAFRSIVRLKYQWGSQNIYNIQKYIGDVFFAALGTSSSVVAQWETQGVQMEINCNLQSTLQTVANTSFPFVDYNTLYFHPKFCMATTDFANYFKINFWPPGLSLCRVSLDGFVLASWLRWRWTEEDVRGVDRGLHAVEGGDAGPAALSQGGPAEYGAVGGVPGGGRAGATGQ